MSRSSSGGAEVDHKRLHHLRESILWLAGNRRDEYPLTVMDGVIVYEDVSLCPGLLYRRSLVVLLFLK
jgi:hypothetical protein